MTKGYVNECRVVTLVANPVFFVTCTTKTKPWKFHDVPFFDVKLLDTKEWLSKTKLDLKSLNKIMRPQLNYYKKKDFRVYKKLNKSYE